MKRWNGWGDENVHVPVPETGSAFFGERIGVATPQKEIGLETVLKAVPDSRLSENPLIKTDAIDRIRHARGQSLADWVAMRSGDFGVFPDGVAYPMSEADIRSLMDYAKETGSRLIPYGGGSSVVGHINPKANDIPVVTVDMGRMNQLESFDEKDNLATFGAGVLGPDMEAQLRARGYTLGHFPQSFEGSSLGGWIATRSSGQQSLHYGRIEDLFAGGRMETPIGTLDFPSFPASAAGPDLKQIALGSEGRMGIISQATMRVSPLPEHEEFRAIFFPDFETAVEAVRTIAQSHLPLSMLRLSCPIETETNLALAGHVSAIKSLEQVLAWRGVKDEKCLLTFGYTGQAKLVRATIRATEAIAGQFGGVHLNVGKIFGRQWQKARFRNPYIRNSLWDMGYAIDTVETATTWHNAVNMLEAIEGALDKALEAIGEKVHYFTHLSHVYAHGTSVYTSYIFRLAAEPQETLRRWQILKQACSEAIVGCGGTISHQHGVGTDHMPYLEAEKGRLGIETLQIVFEKFDPNSIMNLGKLVE